MRLWSLSPRYLDQQGLNGLWREAIMAKNALEQREEHGYYDHPQLNRFKVMASPVRAINYYLQHVYQESLERGFDYDEDAFEIQADTYYQHKVAVTNGQLDFEEGHLKDKLKERGSTEKHNNLTVGQRFLDTHPLFHVVNGDVEEWEKG